MADRPLPPPPDAGAPGRSRWLRPGVVLPALAVVLVLAIVFTPQNTIGRVGNDRLTSYSTESQGARGFHESLRRLGWRVERRLTPFDGAAATDAVYLMLDPPVEPTALEVHRLLEAVRGGASLVFVASRGSTLSDSLSVRPTTRGGPIVLDTAAVRARCDTVTSGGIIDWPGGRPWLFALRRTGPLSFVGDTTFVHVTGTRGASAGDRAGDDEDDDASAASDEDEGAAIARAHPGLPNADAAVVGFALGRGRVLAISDPDFLRNDVVRVCRWNMGVVAVSALDWAAARAPGTSLRRAVFAEYHQGYGRHASVVRTAREFLVRAPLGRVLLVLAIASLLLLLAAAARPLVPLARARFERRSPLEHVGALSRAYEQAGATRTAARQLARGVRRRHAHGGWRRANDEEFLRSVAARHPRLAPDVERVIRATNTAITPAELVHVGRAIESIERTLHDS